MSKEQPLTRQQITEIFSRPENKGAGRTISKTLGIRATNVSNWLKNDSSSRRVAAACNELAKRLLKAERRNLSAHTVFEAFRKEYSEPDDVSTRGNAVRPHLASVSGSPTPSALIS
jgi:hypothetical protein